MAADTFAAAAGRLAGLAGWLFGWSSDAFWGATPAELAAIVGAATGADAPGAGPIDLGALMERFPDE